MIVDALYGNISLAFQSRIMTIAGIYGTTRTKEWQVVLENEESVTCASTGSNHGGMVFHPDQFVLHVPLLSSRPKIS